MTRTLDVWWDRRLVGQLTQNEHGELGFAYAPEWVSDDKAHPLSASLPKRAEPFKRRECRPFFGGLLPEEGQRDDAAQADRRKTLPLRSYSMMPCFVSVILGQRMTIFS